MSLITNAEANASRAFRRQLAIRFTDALRPVSNMRPIALEFFEELILSGWTIVPPGESVELNVDLAAIQWRAQEALQYLGPVAAEDINTLITEVVRLTALLAQARPPETINPMDGD